MPKSTPNVRSNWPANQAHTGSRTQSELADILQQVSESGPSPGTHALTTFLENSPDPVLLFDEAGNIIAKNQRATEFWHDDNNFIPPRLLNEVSKVDASGSPFREEKKHRLIAIEAVGGKRYFLPTVFRLCKNSHQDENEICHRIIACILKDETIWERTERISQNLLASISHELNTPLTSARLALYLLAEQKIGKLNDKQSDLVERAKQDLDREILSIQNVIDMIRSDGIRHDTADTEHLNLHELIEEAICDFESQIKAMHLPLNREYSKVSPWVCIEHETAELVIHQLITCILKYTDERAQLTIATSIEDGHCLLELTTENDEQVDFPPDDLFTIQMDSQRASQLRCADLGLRVAQEMVAPYGGSLGCQHFKSSGRLHFRFPLLTR